MMRSAYLTIASTALAVVTFSFILPAEAQSAIPPEIEASLKRQGYNRMYVIRGNRAPYKVRACLGSDRIEMNISRRGRIIDRSRIDGCRPPANKGEINEAKFRADGVRKMLRQKGYNRIELIRGKGFPYTVRACQGANRISMNIDGDGIIDRSRIDGCLPLPQRVRRKTPQAEPENVVGFDRYGAVVCSQGDKLSLIIGQYGKIQKEKRIGRCRNKLSKAKVRENLSNRGLIVLSLTERRRGWAADVCDGTNRYALRINPNGRVRREETPGNCRSQTMLEVLKSLEDRGAQRVNAFVEGCFKGNRYRWEFDRFGNRTDRERIGNC